MFSKNKVAIILQLMILVGSISTTLFSCKNNKETPQTTEKYRIFNPIQADSSYTQEYVAEIQSTQNVELRARAKGFIERIYVDEGKPVAKGQVLFLLNASEYRQEVLKAKALMSVAQAELKQSEANIRSVGAEISQVNVEEKNIRLLNDNNVISKTELDMVKAKLNATTAKKEESIALKEAALAKIQEANATIQLANLNLGFTEIRAPFTGVLGRIPNKIGALIDEGTLLTTLSNTSEMYVYFNVSENDYLKYVMNNQKNNFVKLKLSNGEVLPQTGVIETIDGQIDPSTGNLSFRAKFPNTQKWLKHGSSGKVLVSNILNNAILIPQQSTFEVQENLYVYVLDKNNTIQQQKIVPQMRIGNMYAVKEGLSTSDKVLFDGVQLVKDGDKITPDFKALKDILNSQK
jgi:multidrug efflux pump subunit AcrA (membrane-fusion protein)